jgi:hypothetical protein
VPNSADGFAASAANEVVANATDSASERAPLKVLQFMPLTQEMLDIWKLHNSAMRGGLLFRRKVASLRKIIPNPGNIAAYSQFIHVTPETPILFLLFHSPQNPAWKGLATRVCRFCGPPLRPRIRTRNPFGGKQWLEPLCVPSPGSPNTGEFLPAGEKCRTSFIPNGVVFANEYASDIVWNN